MVHLIFALVLSVLAVPAWAQNATLVIPLCGAAGAQSPCSASNPFPTTSAGASGGTVDQGSPAAVGSAWPVTLAIGGALNSVSNPIFIGPTTGALGSGTANATTPFAAQMMVSDGTNLQRLLAPIILGDGVNGNNMESAGIWGWNGASWDKVRTDTTSGLWVQNKAALPAGSAIIGKVGIDQTTPGTTNAVVATGNVVSGATDSGNPLKVGGVYNSAIPTFTTGQRGDLQFNINGHARIQLNTGAATGADARANTVGFVNQQGQDATGVGLGMFPYVFNGTTWDRQRGDTTGAFSVGNVASGATDSGNPLKVGGVYNSTLPTYTSGQRGDLQVDTRGRLFSGIASFYTGLDGVANNAIAATPIPGDGNLVGRPLAVVNHVFNGTTWDRLRGTTNGVSAVPSSGVAGGGSFLNIAAGQATTTVKSGAGTLYAIVLNSAATATNTTTVYDNTAGSGPVIAIPAVTTATIPVTLSFGSTGLAFATGLTVVTAAANGGNMTFVYK